MAAPHRHPRDHPVAVAQHGSRPAAEPGVVARLEPAARVVAHRRLPRDRGRRRLRGEAAPVGREQRRAIRPLQHAPADALAGPQVGEPQVRPPRDPHAVVLLPHRDLERPPEVAEDPRVDHDGHRDAAVAHGAGPADLDPGGRDLAPRGAVAGAEVGQRPLRARRGRGGGPGRPQVAAGPRLRVGGGRRAAVVLGGAAALHDRGGGARGGEDEHEGGDALDRHAPVAPAVHRLEPAHGARPGRVPAGTAPASSAAAGHAPCS